jgi:hypothetical protein
MDRRRGINSTSDQEDRYVGFGAVSVATMPRDGQSGFPSTGSGKILFLAKKVVTGSVKVKAADA